MTQEHQQLKSRMAFNPEMRQSFNNEVDAIRKYVSDAFYSCPQPDAIDHDWLSRVVARYYRENDKKPKPAVQPVEDFSQLYDAFLNSKNQSPKARCRYYNEAGDRECIDFSFRESDRVWKQ